MPEHASSVISQAVLDTLLYSDVFDFPLTARETHKYLSGRAATYEEVCQVLNSDPGFVRVGSFFVLNGREELVHLREKRGLRSQELLPHAIRQGRIIRLLPFVRMVALTGSLAVGNVSDDEDFDYMLVTRPGRLWMARAFVLLFGRLTRLVGHRLCPNVIVTENSLTWREHDLYSARDLCQMIPVAGMDVYQRLMQENGWVKDVLPNAYEETMAMQKAEAISRFQVLQKIFEVLLGGRLGDRFERWEMNRKIERFSHQTGFGKETIFNADICQGNFDHHRQWTQQQLRKRGRSLSVATNFHKEKML